MTRLDRHNIHQHLINLLFFISDACLVVQDVVVMVVVV